VPYLRGLMRSGSSNLHARSVLPSASAANWASMVMGAGPELHGFTTWGSKSPDMPSRVLDDYGLFPSIYSLLRQQRPNARIGVIYEWSGIGYLFPKAAVNESFHCDGDSAIAATSVKYITEQKPDFLFIHFHDVDSVGHHAGHDTPEYYAAVERTDQYVGQIIESLKRANMLEETVIMFTADHGGIQKNHGGTTMVEMEIPWIISGPGIQSDFNITESVMTFDTAATIAQILNLQPPQVWIGRPVKSIFKK
jgi:predicted AlkP superfamily pyrophosphatase or phosphodiesterase